MGKHGDRYVVGPMVDHTSMRPAMSRRTSRGAVRAWRSLAFAHPDQRFVVVARDGRLIADTLESPMSDTTPAEGTPTTTPDDGAPFPAALSWTHVPCGRRFEVPAVATITREDDRTFVHVVSTPEGTELAYAHHTACTGEPSDAERVAMSSTLDVELAPPARRIDHAARSAHHDPT